MKQKRVSIIGRNDRGFHRNALLHAAQKNNLKAEIITLDKGEDLEFAARKLGDAVVWRSSGLDKRSERTSIGLYLSNKLVISEAVFINPYVAHKYFQQSVLRSNSVLKKYAITTYKNQTEESIRRLVDGGKLKLPIIAKPDKGDRGEGISYLSDFNELKDFFDVKSTHKKFVYQSFIKNSGDWRVIVVGGAPIGAIKRVAKDGSFLNNISQGASSFKETDEKILSAISDIAVKAASVFNLRFCGVDIIFDETNNVYKILELNTAPQWNGEGGFESVVGVDVADKLMVYVNQMLARDSTEFSSLVSDYYESNIGYSNSACFHFNSRMWLWNGNTKSRRELDRLREWYVGTDDDQSRRIISDILDRPGQDFTVNEAKKFREKYFARYSALKAYNALLFKVIFSDSIYGLDIRPLIREKVSDTEFIELFGELINDPDAQRVLSTHAANYFYLLKNYFKDRLTLSTRVLVDPYEVLGNSLDYSPHINNGELNEIDALKQKIYLLTHIIIGESRFYQRKITITGYKDVLFEIEKTIKNNYFKVTLDNKCEFLVCAQLLGVKSSLEQMILDEANLSKSWSGNFIVDMFNIHGKDIDHNLRTAEHRNALFLMASGKFQHRQSINTTHSVSSSTKLPSIGRLARIEIAEIENARILARTDTGATTSSIHCSSAEITDEGLVVNFGSDIFGLGRSKEYIFTKYKKTEVKRQGLNRSERYSVSLTIKHNGLIKVVEFTLASREDMLYPVLLGRNYLKGSYLVDTSKQFIN